MAKLINLRGRVVECDEKDVPDLLKRGYVFVPQDQPNMTYSPVHDRGKDFREDYIPQPNAQKIYTPKMADILEVKVV